MMSNKLFTKATWILSALGLALNLALVYLTDLTGLPLYLDCVGTVLTAALGGLLPGVAVGFLSNCITSFLAISPDPMTLYYGFLSVLIAAVTAWISRAGLLRRWYGWTLLLCALTLIGGALGSLVTWALYGFSFGQGITAPLAQTLFQQLQLDEFTAQFSADMLVDLADKTLTTAILGAALYLLPESLLRRLPLGDRYLGRSRLPSPASLSGKHLVQLGEERLFRKRSIHTKITALILVSTTILSVVAVSIGIATYRAKLIARYSVACQDAVSMMLCKLDGDDIGAYLAQGDSAPGYAQTEQALMDILNGSHDLKYMYVYRIEPDGCHVVFDLDVEGLAGAEPGAVVPFDESFPYVEALLRGEEIPVVITNDTYGWLLTVYRPLRDSSGSVAAYAAADIDMQDIRANTYTFCINITSLLFGVMIVIATFALWYCDHALLDPLSILAEQARGFDFDGTKKGERVRDRHTVKTGDELEEIFSAMCRTEDAIAARVVQLNAKNMEISLMQRNIIFTLANMVENRDGSTGGHIKRTASYVQLIGAKLEAAGLYPETVNDAYVKMLYDSAPLHDIGKIKIPDAILNKPGKLTAEEFELMKTHTAAGREILQSSLTDIEDDTWLSMAIEMAGCHHEKWDGTGYPLGLSGEQIPLCARIMAVSDVFDALVSARSYKPPFPLDDALRIIREGAGTHFDPKIAAVFLDSRAEISAIMQEK